MDLAAIPWGTMSPLGVLLLIVIMIIRGDLVPRKIHESIVSDRDFWRGESMKQQGAVAENIQALQAVARMLDRLPPSGGG